ncbi:hypothetical protein GQR58_020431 [Nymphon striatum]|nr:hypothetical protein GQR58_020431 [Nymphon striatum]
MRMLFGVDLRQDIQHFAKLYDYITGLTSLRIPELIQSESIGSQGAYILSSEVEGSVPDNSKISMKLVEQLAEHLARLHQDQHKNWGLIHNPLFDQNDWQIRLRNTLEKSTQNFWFTVQAANADEELIFVGKENYPPFSFLDENKNPVGIDVDIINEAIRVAGIKAKIDLYPLATLILGDEEVGLLRDYFISEELDDNKKINKFLTRTSRQLLTQVSLNRRRVAIYSTMAGQYELLKYGINNLKAIPYKLVPDYPSYLAFVKSSTKDSTAACKNIICFKVSEENRLYGKDL